MIGLVALNAHSLGSSSSVTPATTFDPANTDSHIQLSPDSLTATAIGTLNYAYTRSTTSHVSGKYYLEVTVLADPSANGSIALGLVNNNESQPSNWIGQTANSFGVSPQGNVYVNSVHLGTITPWTGTNVVDFAFDFDLHRAWVRVDGGLWNNDGTADPANNINGFDISALSPGSPFFFSAILFLNGMSVRANFGIASFVYPAPNGFGNWFNNNIAKRTFGTSAGVAVATATSTIKWLGTGMAGGIGAASSVGTSSAVVSGVGASPSVGAASGVGAASVARVGAAAGTGAASSVGAGTTAGSGVGSAAGVGAAGSVTAATVKSVALASAVGAASGTSVSTTFAPAAGTAAGVSGAASTTPTTWNTTDAGGHYILSNSNKTAIFNTGPGWTNLRTSASRSSGKLYIEFKVTTAGSFNDYGVGFANGTAQTTNAYLGQTNYGGACYAYSPSGDILVDGVGFFAGTGPLPAVNPALNDVFGLSIDFTAGKIWVSKNNTALGTGNPASGLNPQMTFTPGTVGPLYATLTCVDTTADGTWTVQPTSSSQTYLPPLGFSSWGDDTVSATSGVGKSTAVGGGASSGAGAATGAGLSPGASAVGASAAVGVASGVSSSKNFFVAAVGNGGNDSHVGSQASPWLTVGKVNATVTAGSAVFFNGGDTFTDAGIVAVDSTSYASYGTGTAMIAPTGNANGFTSSNVGGLTISNLTFTGPGGVTTGIGIRIGNDQIDDTVYSNLTLTNVTVTNFGRHGIVIYGGVGAGRGGWNNINLNGVLVHDCTSQGGTPIFLVGKYGSAQAGNPTITNAQILNSTIHDCPGAAVEFANGFQATDCSDVLIKGCVAHHIGANANNVQESGGFGFQTYDSTRVVISGCESHHNTFAAFGNGGGFSLGGGNIDCRIEFCYAHDNDGQGYHLVSYADSSVTHSDRNIVRYNLSVNNGLKGGAGSQVYRGTGLIVECSGTATMTCDVYSNTFVNSNPRGGDSSIVEQYITSTSSSGSSNWASSPDLSSDWQITGSGVSSTVTGDWRTIRVPTAKSSGKAYIEFICLVGSPGGTSDTNYAFGLTDAHVAAYLGSSGNSAGIHANGSPITVSGAFTGTGDILPHFGTNAGEVYGISVDFDAGKFWIAKNNINVGGGDPASASHPQFTFTPGQTLYAAITQFNGSLDGVWGIQAAATSQTFTAPSGFPAWDSGSVSNCSGYVFNNLFVSTDGGYMHRDDLAGSAGSAAGLLFQGNDWWVPPPPTQEFVLPTPAAWNTSDATAAGITLSNGNIDAGANSSPSNWFPLRTADSKSSGLWYCEMQCTVSGTTGGTYGLGFSDTATPGINSGDQVFVHYQGDIFAVGFFTGFKNSTLPNGAAAAAGDIYGLAINCDTGKIWISYKNTWLNGDPVAGTNPSATFPPGSALSAAFFDGGPGAGINNGTWRLLANVFNQNYVAPAGFSCWDNQSIFHRDFSSLQVNPPIAILPGGNSWNTGVSNAFWTHPDLTIGGVTYGFTENGSLSNFNVDSNIGLWTSTNGVKGPWTAYVTNPIISKNPGDWDDHELIMPCVPPFKFPDGLYHCYYGAKDGSNLNRIGLARSPDLVNWTKYSGNPVTTTDNVADPCVLVHPSGTGYIMYAVPGYASGHQVWYFESTDGLSWSFGGIALDYPTPGNWDRDFIGITNGYTVLGETGMHGWFEAYVSKNRYGFYEMMYDTAEFDSFNQHTGKAISANGLTFKRDPKELISSAGGNNVLVEADGVLNVFGDFTVNAPPNSFGATMHGTLPLDPNTIALTAEFGSFAFRQLNTVFPGDTTTWNPTNGYGYCLFSNSNQTVSIATTSNTTWKTALFTSAKSSGKWYAEIKCTAISFTPSANYGFGFASVGFSPPNVNGYLGTTYLQDYPFSGGDFAQGSVNVSSGFAAGTAALPSANAALNDVFGLLIDFTAGKIWIAKNNLNVATGAAPNPASDPPQLTFTPSVVGALSPAVSFYDSNSGTWTVQATSGSQTYSPPAGGFTAWG